MTSFRYRESNAAAKDQAEIAIVDAIYTPRPEDLGINNPLIRALPYYLEVEEVLNAFENKPAFSPNDRNKTRNRRIILVGSLNQYIETLTCHRSLIESIFQVITQDYMWRNPATRLQNQVEDSYRESMHGKISPILPIKPPHGTALTLLGVSGIGKTTSIDRTLSFFPRVIRHPSISKSNLQVVWLKVDCPSDGSPKQLFSWIVEEYDHILGTYYIKEAGKRAGLDALLNKAANVAPLHHTGLIWIDEIQFGTGGAGRHGDPLMNYLVLFSNKARVPLLLSGTLEAEELFKKSLHLTRRICDGGSETFRNMQYDEEWTMFLTGLFAYQWTKIPVRLTNTLSKTIYDLTQGVHALVVRIFQMAQIKAIREGSEKLSTKLFVEVARSRLGPVQPMLESLRDETKESHQYDVQLAETLKILKQEVDQDVGEATMRTEAKSLRQGKAKMLSAISELTSMGISQAEAVRAVELALQNDPAREGGPLVVAACQAIGSRQTHQTKKVRDLRTLSELVRGCSSPEEAIGRLSREGLLVGTAPR